MTEEDKQEVHLVEVGKGRIHMLMTIDLTETPEGRTTLVAVELQAAEVSREETLVGVEDRTQCTMLTTQRIVETKIFILKTIWNT